MTSCAGTEGVITVTVTGIDHARYSTLIDVDPRRAPTFASTGWRRIDDSGGNGDGAVDAGETVQLWIELFSTGDMMGEGLWAERLHSGENKQRYLLVSDKTSRGGCAFNNSAFSVTVDQATSDETPVEFLIDIRFGGRGTGQEFRDRDLDPNWSCMSIR